MRERKTSRRHILSPARLDDEHVEAYLGSHSQYVTESGCRIWLGSVTKGRGWGYGVGSPLLQMRFDTRYVHRVAYLVTGGVVPEGMELDHRCNVRCCINPDHLVLGTPRDNHIDAIKKGRKNVFVPRDMRTN